MLRKLLGLAVSFALFPKPLNLAHAAGAALVLGAGTAHALAPRRAHAAPLRALAGHKHAGADEEAGAAAAEELRSPSVEATS